MARMNLASGLCPVCARTVARTLTTHHGVTTEAYHCPVHGRRASTSGLTVAEWVAAPSMAMLGEMFGVPLAAR